MRQVSFISAFITVAILTSACADQQIMLPPTGPGLPPDAGALARASAVDEGGCAAWSGSSKGVARGMAIPRKMLPFHVKPVRRDARTQRSLSRTVSIKAEPSDGESVMMECLVDESLTVDDIAAALGRSQNGRWRAVLEQLRDARELPDSGRWQRGKAASPPSPGSTASSSAGVAMQESSETCAQIALVFQWTDSYGVWNSLTVTFTVCYAGGGDAYSWMVNNGYTQSSYVVVDADNYSIQQTDSVLFFADIVTTSYEIPYILGWKWTPASGVSDHWTTACADNWFQCKTMVHGSGRIAFDVILGSEQLTGSVEISATAPDDVGDIPGDADFAEGWGTFTKAIPIAAQQSVAILADAVRMGEWRYTQGCAQCAGGPNWEPAVNIPAQFGDCTDFVWIAVKHVLGTRWPHAKISTRMFNSFSSAKLALHGYVQVDSASVRQGDIVVRTTTTGCRCGHAGVFTGWGAGGSPMGHANNGVPAKPDQPNDDKNTGKFNFRQGPGQLTKFFRPVI